MKTRPKSQQNSGEKRKRYFQHYKKGKYYLINLDLKKKGHEQK